MDKYGLIGYPLTHSFSRDYFNEKFENEGIDATYINYEILSVEELPEIVHTTLELRGLNVTIPYKEQVMPLLDSISPEAEAVGAVNVIKVIRDKDNVTLRGYNSDVIGFIKSLEPLLEPHHRKALVLGTGGAGKAVFYGLRQLGLEACYVSRTKKPGCLTYEEVTPRDDEGVQRHRQLHPDGYVSECRHLPALALRGHGQPHAALRPGL